MSKRKLVVQSIQPCAPDKSTWTLVFNRPLSAIEALGVMLAVARALES